MDVNANIGKFSILTVVKVALFLLIILVFIAGICAIFSVSTAISILSSWIYMLALPLGYGLMTATSTRHASLTITNFGNKNDVLNTIDKLMTEHGDIAAKNGNTIRYLSSKKFGRFINVIFDVFVRVEVSDDTIRIDGNKNFLRFLLPKINKIDNPTSDSIEQQVEIKND